MKKLLALFTFLTMALVSPVMADDYINIATGPTGGTYYPVGAAMAKVWTDHIDGLKASAQSTGGTRNNIQLLGSGDAEVCFADGLSYDAFNGLSSYEGNPQGFLRTMAPLYPEVFHILVAKDSGIKTLADLKGKRVSVGAVGGSVSITAAQLFELAGLNMEKDLKPEYLGHADTVAAFSDRRIDASITVGAIGIASAVETTTLGLVEIMSLPDDIIKKMCDSTPYLSPYTIAANTYKGQGALKNTFSSPNILAVHEKVDNDMAYAMTKALFDYKADLTAVTKTMEAMVPEDIDKVRIPLHPGAEKYYKELGLR